MPSFSALPLDPLQLATLEQIGYLDMTPIQAAALPALLGGRDVIAQADTGTGKTAAFGLAALARVEPGAQRPQALMLCPTRELAAQVADELRRLGRWQQNLRVVELCGGKPAGRQRETLERGADIIVGTPGRVLDHLDRGALVLDHVRQVVLDEADRMLDMGFIDEVRAILDQAPAQRQTALFSATIDQRVHDLSAALQRDPLAISAPAEAPPAIAERRYALGELERVEALLRALAHHQPEQAIIFCGQRATCDALVEAMRAAGFDARALHGGMEQRDRDAALAQLTNRSLRWLVATDVAARGIDIPELPAVINFDPPRDAETHTHRIGRTGRAGASGLAISLLDDHQAKRSAVAPEDASSLPAVMEPPEATPYATIALHAGRRDKLRAGDIVGALTGDLGFKADDIGVIQILENVAYVAIRRHVAQRALAAINQGHIKKRKIRATLPG